MKLKGVIFDLDGTLVDSMEIWRNLGSQYLITKGKKPKKNLDRIIKTMSLFQSAQYFREYYKIEDSEEKIIYQINKLIEDAYFNTIQLKPNVYQQLERLKENKIKMIIATNTDKYLVFPALKRLKIANFFENVITCSEVGIGKDYPDIFYEALALLGTAKEETVIVEDALYAIRTAKEAGFEVIAVHDKSAKKEKRRIKKIADHYIKSFDEWEIKEE
jgi:HAD superfamily hydrolase (TIGR01509 family)